MKNILSTIAVLALAFTINAQPGILDPTFDPGTGANNAVFTSAIQSDGKIIIGGSFTSFNGTSRNRIARLKTDGTLDLTFNIGSGASNYISNTAIQSNGKIIIAGALTTFNGTARSRIARLNTDGSLDTTFNLGVGASSTIRTTAIQSDGKIIIGGDFTSYNGTARNGIARINTDGSIDLTFNPGSGTNGYVSTATIQSDGKIIIGGDFDTYNGVTNYFIARINSNGTLDTAFNTGGGTNYAISNSAIQSNGKIIIVGGFTSYNGIAMNYIARLNANGTLDPTFNPGTGANSIINTSSIQSDGRIVIAGNFNSFNGTARNNIARLNANGTHDLSFNPGTGANDRLWTTAIQSDGTIIIGGDMGVYNGTARNRIARINGGGALSTNNFKYETSFAIYPNPANNMINVNYEIKSNEKVSINVTNLAGQVVATKNNGSQVSGSYKSEMDLSSLANGLYLVQLKVGDRVHTEKISVVK